MQQRTSQPETQSGDIRNIVEKFQIPKKGSNLGFSTDRGGNGCSMLQLVLVQQNGWCSPPPRTAISYPQLHSLPLTAMCPATALLLCHRNTEPQHSLHSNLPLPLARSLPPALRYWKNRVSNQVKVVRAPRLNSQHTMETKIPYTASVTAVTTCFPFHGLITLDTIYNHECLWHPVVGRVYVALHEQLRQNNMTNSHHQGCPKKIQGCW